MPTSGPVLGTAPAPARRAAGLIAVAIGLLGGCAGPANVPLPTGAAPFGADTVLIYVPGIGGVGSHDRRWVEGLRAGGYLGKVEWWDWTGRFSGIDALLSHRLQRSEAARIAGRVNQLRRESPSAPVVLAGHSAGAGVALQALEGLPPGVSVDSVVLLSSAVSRDYDLTPALRHVRGRADAFNSDRDTLVLAIGTFVFGTVDGVHGESAGHGGFVQPAGADPEAYTKLRQHPFARARRLVGDDGGHVGTLSPGVAAWLVAPLLPGFGPRKEAAPTLAAARIGHPQSRPIQ